MLYFLVSELFLELSSCLRLPTEQTMDEQPQGRHVHSGMYSANQLVLTVENRDSMAFLAAVFTGEFSMYTPNKKTQILLRYTHRYFLNKLNSHNFVLL